MSAYAQMLVEKRANVWEQSKALLDAAASEKRELTAEETVGYEAMSADLTSLRAQIDKLEQADADAKAIGESLRKLAETPKSIEVPGAPDAQSEALRSFLKGERRSLEVTGSALERRTGLNVGTSSAGGATLPTTFYGKLWANLILTANLINAGATVMTTANGDVIQMPATTAHSTAALVAEAAALSESDPTFVQRSLSAFKYGVLISVSKELTQDTGVDLEGYLAMQAGRAVGNAFGTHLVSGTGGGTQPTGLLTSTTLGVTGQTGVVGAPSFDNLIDLYHAVIQPYRNSPAAAWLVNDLTAGSVRKLKDTVGRYLWEPSLTAGEPDRILNKPVYTDPNIPAAALSAKSVVFGDLAAYFVRIVESIRFEQSLDFAFNTDQIVFRCILRGDGILLDQTGAVKHYIGAAT